MSDGFPIGDIIILGAIAAFIILRYRSMLGDKTGRDPGDLTRRQQQGEEMERIIQLSQKPETVKPVIPTVTFDGFTGEVRESLRAMNRIDPELTPDNFLDGAKSAFEMVLEAYRERDHDTLKMLLDKPLYQQFADAIKKEEERGEKSETTLVAITRAEITEASLAGSKATMAVSFTSDQIHITRDKEGKIVAGDASQEVEIDDTWRFTRDLKSSDPNWTIIDT